MVPSKRTRLLVLTIAATLAASGGVANSHPSTKSVDEHVQEHFGRGQQLLEKKKYEEAHAELSQALELKPDGVGILLWLGECTDKLGHPARAWRLYARAERLAKEREREVDRDNAHKRAEHVAKRLPKLVLKLPTEVRDAPGAAVAIDGELVESELRSAPIPVEPELHTIVVSATGKPDWRTEVDATGSTAEIPVNVPPWPQPEPSGSLRATGSVLPTTSASASVAPTSTGAPKGPSTSAPDLPSGARSGVPAWAWVSGATGLAAGAVAIGFLADWVDVQSWIDTNCEPDVGCRAKVPVIQAQNEHLWRSYGLFLGFGITSLAALGISAYGVVTGVRAADPRKAGSTGWRRSVTVAPTLGGIQVHGRF